MNSVPLPENDPARLFTVQIRHFTPPALNTSVFGCVGTLITFEHVLSSAACVNRVANTILVIHGRTNLNWIPADESYERVNNVYLHPDFQYNNQRVANVAVSRVSNNYYEKLSY